MTWRHCASLSRSSDFHSFRFGVHWLTMYISTHSDDTQWGDVNDEYFMLNVIALEKSMDAYIRDGTWQQQT